MLSLSPSYTVVSLVPVDSQPIVGWCGCAPRLFMQQLFVFRISTMTCQSSVLIRLLSELCLPSCTLECDLQLPRQLQFIWLHAMETSLPHFSSSLASLEFRDAAYLKGSSFLQHSVLHCIS